MTVDGASPDSHAMSLGGDDVQSFGCGYLANLARQENNSLSASPAENKFNHDQ